MQDIAKAIEDLMTKNPSFSLDADFVALRDFYLEMLKSGIATKQEYSLPSLDTVGHFSYQNQ